VGQFRANFHPVVGDKPDSRTQGRPRDIGGETCARRQHHALARFTLTFTCIDCCTVGVGV